MLKGYKTEISLSEEQIQTVNKTLGVYRFVYNFYLAHNKEIYERDNKYISGIDFYIWLNNEFIPGNPSYIWINEAGRNLIKQGIMNADEALSEYIKGNCEYPVFKKKGRPDVKLYFVKKDKKELITYEEHRIKIPFLGWVDLKEDDSIPADRIINRGTITCQSGKYNMSVFFDEPKVEPTNRIKSTLMKLHNKLSMNKRSQSRKYDDNDKRKKIIGEAARQDIHTQQLAEQELHQGMENMEDNNVKCNNKVAKTKPSYISMEDLNVSKMMKYN